MLDFWSFLIGLNVGSVVFILLGKRRERALRDELRIERRHRAIAERPWTATH